MAFIKRWNRKSSLTKLLIRLLTVFLKSGLERK